MQFVKGQGSTILGCLIILSGTLGCSVINPRMDLAVLLVLFALVEVAFLVVTPQALPGVIERLGIIEDSPVTPLDKTAAAMPTKCAPRDPAMRLGAAVPE